MPCENQGLAGRSKQRGRRLKAAAEPSPAGADIVSGGQHESDLTCTCFTDTPHLRKLFVGAADRASRE